MHSATVKAKVDQDLKSASESVLKQLGMDMTSAIKVFLTQVVARQGLPFEVRLAQPNARTLAAIEDSYTGRVERADSVEAMFDALER